LFPHTSSLKNRLPQARKQPVQTIAPIHNLLARYCLTGTYFSFITKGFKTKVKLAASLSKSLYGIKLCFTWKKERLTIYTLRTGNPKIVPSYTLLIL